VKKSDDSERPDPGKPGKGSEMSGEAVQIGASQGRRSGWSLPRLSGTARDVAVIVALRLGGFAVLIAIWALAATQLPAVQLPRPELVWEALTENFSAASGLQLQGLSGGYLSNVLYTVENALFGFAIGASLGMLIGLLSARLQVIRDLSAPALILCAAVPDLVAAPFFLVWFGPGKTAQALIVIFYCFVIVGITSQNAALRLSPYLEESAATLGATRRRSFFTVVVPGSLPSTIGAVRIALATSWSLQAAGEILGSQSGVGRVVVLSQQLSYTAGTIAIVILLAAFALLADGVIYGVLRWMTRWQEAVSR
jgi:ABC-type nitrate/sulfonate/bicarbonate transport system permease component